jgi:hypothetical protein
MLVSLKQMEKALHAIQVAHPVMKSFFFGEWGDALAEKEIVYPYLVASIATPVNFDKKVDNLTISLTFAGKVFTTVLPDGTIFSNLNDINSDLLQVGRDFYDVLRGAPNWQAFGVVTSASAPVYFRDRGADSTAGWQILINIKMINPGGYSCEVPLIDYPADPLNC